VEWKRWKSLKGVGTSKTLQKIVIAFILTFVCARCSGGAYISQQKGGGFRRSSSSEDGEKSTNRPPILYMGSKFIYQDISLSDGKTCRVTMEVKEKKNFEHKQAYWIEVIGHQMDYFNIYDMNLNWIGLFGDGKELETAEPCLQIFKWPLRIGEKWNSRYTLRDFSDRPHGVYLRDSKIDVNIRAYEEVRVPAGTFKALRIQAGAEIFWYAPSIGWIVKEELSFNSKNKSILELLEYDIPKNA